MGVCVGVKVLNSTRVERAGPSQYSMNLITILQNHQIHKLQKNCLQLTLEQDVFIVCCIILTNQQPIKHG